jgi:hypothetical protein
MIVDGKEWKLVPVDGDWAMTQAAIKHIQSTHVNIGDMTVGLIGSAICNAIAAAPAPPVVEVTPAECERIFTEWLQQETYGKTAGQRFGRAMFYAVDAVMRGEK